MVIKFIHTDAKNRTYQVVSMGHCGRDRAKKELAEMCSSICKTNMDSHIHVRTQACLSLQQNTGNRATAASHSDAGAQGTA